MQILRFHEVVEVFRAPWQYKAVTPKPDNLGRSTFELIHLDGDPAVTRLDEVADRLIATT